MCAHGPPTSSIRWGATAAGLTAQRADAMSQSAPGIAIRTWLVIELLPRYAPELTPVELHVNTVNAFSSVHATSAYRHHSTLHSTARGCGGPSTGALSIGRPRASDQPKDLRPVIIAPDPLGAPSRDELPHRSDREASRHKDVLFIRCAVTNRMRFRRPLETVASEVMCSHGLVPAPGRTRMEAADARSLSAAARTCERTVPGGWGIPCSQVLPAIVAVRPATPVHPEGTGLSKHGADDLVAVAAALNSLPCKTLGWRTPAEALTISCTSANTAALRRPPQPKQYLSIRYTERLAEAGAVTSVGSKGDAFHNALAATTIGLYKTELIHPHDPGAAWTTSSWRCWPTSTGATSPAAQRHWACPAG